jgi:hypothetical protein
VNMKTDFKKLTELQSRIPFELFTVGQLLKRVSPYYGRRKFVPCLQEPVPSPCHESNECIHTSSCIFHGHFNILLVHTPGGPGSLVGIATELRDGRSGDRIPVGGSFSARPDRPWGPPSLLYIGYRVIPGGKVLPGRAADQSPPF